MMIASVFVAFPSVLFIDMLVFLPTCDECCIDFDCLRATRRIFRYMQTAIIAGSPKARNEEMVLAALV